MKFLFLTSFLFSSYLSAKEPVKVKWAINEGLNHQVTVAKEFAKEMEKENILVEIHYFSEDEQELYDGPLKNKNFDMTQNYSAKFYEQEKRLKIWEVPFLFRSSEHIENFIASQRSQEILNGLDNEHEKAITFTFAGGFLHMITPERLTSFTQLKGQNCIFDDRNSFYKYFSSPLGIKSNFENEAKDSKSMCLEELGAEIRLHLIRHNNFFNITGHRIISRVLRVSNKILNKMSEAQREKFISSLKKYTKKERMMVYKELDLTIERLKFRQITPNFWTNEMKDKEVQKLDHLMQAFYKEIGSEIDYVKALNPKVYKPRSASK